MPIVGAVVVLIVGSASASHPNSSVSKDATPYTCDQMTLVHHVKRARALIRRAYDLSRWRDATPAKSSEKRAWQQHRRCVRFAPERYAIHLFRQKLEKKFVKYRDQQLAASSLTPYACGSAGSWAIPCEIVACESGYSWGAYNPSGAAGPYQLMAEHGRPFPVTSEADKLAHHRIASQLWAGGAGRSNWVC